MVRDVGWWLIVLVKVIENNKSSACRCFFVAHAAYPAPYAFETLLRCAEVVWGSAALSKNPTAF